MGMDVYGVKPQTERGGYFRNNVWWWHPLWDYCCFLDPHLLNKVPDAHLNSGDGLDGYDARQLGFLLKNTIENGVAKTYVDEYIKLSEELDDEQCFCVNTENIARHDCLVCKGSGLMPNFYKSYNISLENIEEFSNFLLECGGFQIC